jgi:hypothetical protein
MSDRMEDDPHDTNSQQSLEQNDLELQADEEFATMSDIQNYFNFGNNSTQGSPTTSTAKQIQQQTVQPKPNIAPRVQIPPQQINDQILRQQMMQHQMQQGITFPPNAQRNAQPVRIPTVHTKMGQPQIAIVMPQMLNQQPQQSMPVSMPGFNGYQQYANYLQFLQRTLLLCQINNI